MEEWRRRKEGRSGEGREERAGKSSKDCESRSSFFFFFFRGLGIGDEKKKKAVVLCVWGWEKTGGKKRKIQKIKK